MSALNQLGTVQRGIFGSGRPIFALVALLLLALAACDGQSVDEADLGVTVFAAMAGPDGASMGTVALTQGPNGMLVSADLTGLTEGWHGFHIHETGSCAPDFSAAGGHLNPDDKGHGFLHGPNHPGDMPNIYAGADGTARANVFNTQASLKSILDDNGSAIIVHAKPDSYGEDPGAGDRVACGVIDRG